MSAAAMVQDEQSRWYAWMDEHRDVPGAFEDVLLEAGDPVPLATKGRMPELVRMARRLEAGKPVPSNACPVSPRADIGERLLAVLARKRGEWFRFNHIKGIEPTDVLNGELALVLQGVPLEARDVHRHFRTYIDYCEHYELPLKGGSVGFEIRLAPLVTLDGAAPLTQGMLF